MAKYLPPLRVRFAELIRERAARLSYKGLSEEIKKHHPSGKTIERRKLSQLAKRMPVSLTLDELDALDTYLFKTEGFGLESLFPEHVLKSLLRPGKVKLLLGTRPIGSEGRIVGVSKWDMLAMARIYNYMFLPGPTVDVDIVDVHLEDRTLNELTPDNYEEKFAEAEWFKVLKGSEYASVVSIGSSRSSLASEIMLAEMFGVRPFDLNSNKSKLPFYFYWDFRSPHVPPSSFAVDVPPAMRRDEQGEEVFGLKIAGRDTVWVYRPTGDCGGKTRKWETFGVIAVQRRARGQLWVVIAGLTAVGTLGASYQLLSMETAPRAQLGLDSPVRWCVVSVGAEQKRALESRQMKGQDMYTEPQLWPPPAPAARPKRGRPVKE